MKKKKVVIFLYNRLFDSLIQSNFWLYIKDILYDPDNNYQLHLITYEDEEFPLSEEQKALVEEWKSKGMKWTALKWHKGIGLIPKIRDIFQGFFTCMKLRFKGYNRFLSLASVAGTFVYMYSVLLNFKFFLYQFEPHSEYAIDNGMWPESSLQYKMSNFLEKRAAHKAKVIASGTVFMQQRLKEEWKVKADFFKIATVANDEKFTFNQKERDEKRQELGFTEDQQLLFYPGKFGGLYYNEEVASMFKWLKEEIPALHFLIVTPHKDEEVIELFDKAGVDRKHYTICHSGYEDIHKFYFAADFAVISVPPGPSKKFISNIKVGEYLCSGLPYLITEGVSEDYLYATEKGVGVVFKDFKEKYVKSEAHNVKRFLDMDKEELRNHCRAVGLDYRGFKGRNAIFKKAMASLVN